MVIHSRTEDMLKESIWEMVLAAQICIKYKKENGGCLGYPAAIMLLTVADTIGSYHRGDKNYTIQIDGKTKTINGDGFKHFYILNSDYYNCGLSEKSIRKIYDNYRSLLVHNSVIPMNHFITLDDPLHCPFREDALENPSTGKSYPCLSLKPLLKSTTMAASMFIKKIDSIVPTSKQAEIISCRK